MLHSCRNCWFNGLQYGALGLPVGYCSRHQVVLNVAEATTCGQHMRKDLPLHRAKQVSLIHAARYSKEVIVRIYGDEIAKREVSSDQRDINSLGTDRIGGLVSDYGVLNSTIESLAQLNMLNEARAEVAMMSLARGYVYNCVGRGGNWTSGLHLFWWTKKRLAEIPDIPVKDLLTTGGTQLSRQVDLTAWSVMMLRLTLIDDIVEHAVAQNYMVGDARGLLQKCAEAVQVFNIKRVGKWMRAEALPALDKMLPYEKYKELSRKLHKENGEDI
jgi:hypothetical protein